MLSGLFLSSGLFLGWSLGANDAANVIGTAVATKMVRFRTAALAAALFVAARAAMPHMRIHLLEVDAWTRAGPLAVGAFGAFSLGQNDIANVMGGFVRVSPFPEEVALGPLRVSSVEMLLLAGGLAIATGIAAYSRRVMKRLGAGLTAPPLVPVSSSQAVAGAILGISLVRRSPVKWRAVGGIVAGWVLASTVAVLLSLVGLFVLASVLRLAVSAP